MKNKKNDGRIKLPRGTTANERAKAAVRFPGEDDSSACARVASEAIRQARTNPQGVLQAQLENLIDAAELVVERWSEGDLADAVNSLRVDAANAKATFELIRTQSEVPASEPVVFVEGGGVQAVLIPDASALKGYREPVYELVDYDMFENEPDENIQNCWENFSTPLKDYFRKYLKEEVTKFAERGANVKA